MRWPNDVVVDGRKLAGILAEVRDGHVVVGIGVNANHEAGDLPADARVPPTSLRLLHGRRSTGPPSWRTSSRRSRPATGRSSATASRASSATTCAAGG